MSSSCVEMNSRRLLHHILRKLSTPFVQHIFTKPSETILIQCQLLPLSELHKRQLIPIGLRWHFHQAIVNHPDTDIFCKLTKQDGGGLLRTLFPACTKRHGEGGASGVSGVGGAAGEERLYTAVCPEP
ncbi:hypothetical protein AGIG_G3494 [Arapaima gigas]